MYAHNTLSFVVSRQIIIEREICKFSTLLLFSIVINSSENMSIITWNMAWLGAWKFIEKKKVKKFIHEYFNYPFCYNFLCAMVRKKFVCFEKILSFPCSNTMQLFKNFSKIKCETLKDLYLFLIFLT